MRLGCALTCWLRSCLYGGVHPISNLFVYNNMKYNQKTLELEPRLSKLIDSLCFELAVNIPDENSLSLLEILEMRKNSEINQQEFRQLYRDWLQSKSIYDVFTAKQVRIYPKNELISNPSQTKYLNEDSIVTSLELLNNLFNELYLSKKGSDHRLLQDIQNLFEYLDTNGNIHVGLSSLFFLTAAFLIVSHSPIPLNYQQFKFAFKAKNKELCEVEGIVCLRWFKNYFINRPGPNPRQLLQILREVQKGIRSKRTDGILPDILTEALIKWRNTPRFNGLFDSKKKKFEIYQRMFLENEQIFFFNGKEDNPLNINTFIKKYGQNYVKSVQLDTPSLRQFGDIVNNVLNQYLSVIAKTSVLTGSKGSKPQINSSAIYQTPTHQSHSTHNIYQEPHSSFKATLPSHKKNNSGVYQVPLTNGKPHNSTFKEKTPTKKNKGNETRRINVTPTHRNTKTSPFVARHFGSTEKSLSRSKNMTPTKSYGGYGAAAQVYKNSKKEGLQKDSVYEKLFFFRNKRVESFDIVIKRLRGK